jgi:hypothetical protein
MRNDFARYDASIFVARLQNEFARLVQTGFAVEPKNCAFKLRRKLFKSHAIYASNDRGSKD